MISEQNEQQMRLLEIEDKTLDLNVVEKRRLIEALLGSANDKKEFAHMASALLIVLENLVENGMPEYERDRHLARMLFNNLLGA